MSQISESDGVSASRNAAQLKTRVQGAFSFFQGRLNFAIPKPKHHCILRFGTFDFGKCPKSQNPMRNRNRKKKTNVPSRRIVRVFECRNFWLGALRWRLQAYRKNAKFYDFESCVLTSPSRQTIRPLESLQKSNRDGVLGGGSFRFLAAVKKRKKIRNREINC